MNTLKLRAYNTIKRRWVNFEEVNLVGEGTGRDFIIDADEGIVLLLSTGLTDKNGREIYNYDRIRVGDKVAWVHYSINLCTWLFGSEKFDKYLADQCEVINSMYDTDTDKLEEYTQTLKESSKTIEETDSLLGDDK